MSTNCHTAELRATQFFFNNATAPFEEAHHDFRPCPESFTVTQQIAHVAHTIDWFVEGAFRAEGFDTNWAEHQARIEAITSVAEARAWVARSFDAVVAKLEAEGDEGLAVPMAEGPIMGGQPRAAIVGAIVDHTAHHRGALSVYLRLLGIQPPMPYGDF